MASRNASDQFAVELTGAQLDISRFEAHVRRRVISMLRVLQDDLVAKVTAADLGEIRLSRSRRAASERLIRDVRAVINRRYARAESRLASELAGVGSLSHETAVTAMNRVFTFELFRPTLSAADLRALVDRQVVMGEPAADWWRGQAEATRRRFAREIRLGLPVGETNQEIVRRIRGHSTGRTMTVELANGRRRRMHVFKGGVMDTSIREASALVRTSVQSVSNDALVKTYEEHRDVLKGYEVITTLDGRTSDICMARTGAAWDLDGAPLPESTVSEDYPGPPPWHWLCRTILGPITKSWEELISPGGPSSKLRGKLIDTVPDSRRASFDGLMGSVRSFDDFLKAKGEAFARKKLGPAKFDLWNSGKITTRQLIDQSGRPLTLAEVRASIGLAS